MQLFTGKAKHICQCLCALSLCGGMRLALSERVFLKFSSELWCEIGGTERYGMGMLAWVAKKSFRGKMLPLGLPGVHIKHI